METYEHMRRRHRVELSALEGGVTSLDHESFCNGLEGIALLGNGVFCRTPDRLEAIWLLERQRREIARAMENQRFALGAFSHEIRARGNLFHYDGAYDVCRQFGDIEYDPFKKGSDYLSELGYPAPTIAAYEAALRRFFDWCCAEERKAEERESWFMRMIS